MKTAAFSAAELRFGAGYPGPRICRTFTRKGAAVSSQGLPEIAGPLGGRPKADHVARTSSRRSGKVDHAARTSSRRSAKADCPARSSPRRSAKADRSARTSSRRSAKADSAARTSPRRSAKADHAAGLSLGEARKPTAAVVFPRAGLLAARAGPAAGRTARFLIARGKASFYETATFGRRKVFFCSPFCGLLFCPTRAKLALPAGEKPAAPNPGRPAAARPTTATGSRFLRRQRERPTRRPRPSPPAREGSLGAPNDRTFPPGAERKARKGKEKERRKPHAAPAPGTPTPGLARPLRLMRAGRAPSRNAASVAESPQNQHRRSAP